MTTGTDRNPGDKESSARRRELAERVAREARSVPSDTVVVLGASNVSRGVVDIVETAHGFVGRPLDMILASGHGRSYGASSNVLWRRLPGLTQCELWPTLASRPRGRRRTAILTDVGNDLLYGATPEATLQWVAQCATRLSEQGFRLIIAELPIESVRSLGVVRFVAARTMLFPGSPLRFQGLVETCETLNAGLHDIARRHQATVTTARSHWYGVDPIHIRWSAQRAAWGEVLLSLKEDASHAPTTFATPDRKRIRAVRHARREWFGREQHRAQPSLFLNDGTAISMF